MAEIRSAPGPRETEAELAALDLANRAFAAKYAGAPSARQPVHTVYGGAHAYKAETTERLGESALHALSVYGGDAVAFARAVGLAPRGEPLAPGDELLAAAVHARVRGKLEREPVEDFRIDFEDGFGTRPDDEEDRAAVAAARELARAVTTGKAPPFVGIRIKSLGEGTSLRALRTAELFVETLVEAAGALPPNFVITLPKVTVPEQPYVLARRLERLEGRLGLDRGTLGIEFMIETTTALLGPDGRSPLRSFLDACAGRCKGVHLGTYDYTASCGISASAQSMGHPMCDVARGMMILAYAGTGVFLSDGSTNALPVGPHRGSDLTAAQRAENADAVHRAWQLSHGHIRHSLRSGFYQGWDLHAAQLPVRYAACFAFFLDGLPSAAARLRAFVEAQAGHPSGAGGTIAAIADEPATAQALLNYVRRALQCGAIDARDIDATGLTADEIVMPSITRVLEGRRGR